MDSSGTRLSLSLPGMFWSVLRDLPSHPPPRMPIFGVSSPNLCQRQLCVVLQLYRLLLPLTTCCLLVDLQMLGPAYALVPHLPYSGPDAKFVFFSANRFVISDTLASINPYQASIFPEMGWLESRYGWDLAAQSQAPPPPAPRRPSAYPAQRLAASQFLRDVVPANGLGYLRFLELVFPPYNYQCWPQDGHPTLQDWAHTLNWAKNMISIPGLTLRLTMAGAARLPPEAPDQRWELTQAQGDEVLAGYNRILRPLACLGEGGLAHFYADLAWPWKWAAWDDHRVDDVGRSEALWDCIRSYEDVLNEDAERFILGDRYRRDSQKRKREEDRPWQMDFLGGDC